MLTTPKPTHSHFTTRVLPPLFTQQIFNFHSIASPRLTAMSKRRRTSPHSDSDDDKSSVAGGSDPRSDSEYEDAPNGTKSKKLGPKKGKTAKSRKRTKISQADALDPRPLVPQDVYSGLSHTKYNHTVLSPGPVRVALLEWYKTVHGTRGMPWRKPYDPALGSNERAQRAYEVWISEIMLQQTQVVTVIPYYNRWMEKFPTIRDLASATIDEVNALWKGLGYYSRASRLLAGAQKAVAEFGGQLPDNAKDMEAKIPGIGRYSAGAICSIAYGEQVPVLDGNVHRLLSRFLALHAPPKAKATLDILWAGAAVMVDIGNTLPSPAAVEADSLPKTPQYPGDVNQALIELGSTICKVREPSCELCPLNRWCLAYRDFTTTKQSEESNSIIDIEDVCRVCEPVTNYEGVISYPMKAMRKKSREELDIVHVVEWRPTPESENRQFLMVRRPDTGLLAGLYDFPSSTDVSGATLSGDQENLASESLAKILSVPVLPSLEGLLNVKDSESVAISSIRPGGDVLHIFSHIRKIYRVQWVVLRGGDSPPAFHSPPVKGRPTARGKSETRPADVVTNVNGRSGLHTGAIWVPLDGVMETNMGSGVVKVWNAARFLWEGKS